MPKYVLVHDTLPGQPIERDVIGPDVEPPVGTSRDDDESTPEQPAEPVNPGPPKRLTLTKEK
jgi:hypothetical protein